MRTLVFPSTKDFCDSFCMIAEYESHLLVQVITKGRLFFCSPYKKGVDRGLVIDTRPASSLLQGGLPPLSLSVAYVQLGDPFIY